MAPPVTIETPPAIQPRARGRLARFFFRSLRFLISLVVGVALIAAVWFYWRTHASLPQLDGSLRVPGLGARVEVFRDARGVPHLRAESIEDALFAQGFVTAQDRLWQMDLSRRRAEGELSEILGERTLKYDIENRTLGFRQICERAVQELDPDSRRKLAAYTSGVNAFISSHRDRLPIEFFLLGYRPQPWREIDSFSVAMNMAKALGTSWPDELMRERVRSKVSPELYEDLFPDHSTLDRPVAELPPEPRRVGAMTSRMSLLPGRPEFSEEALLRLAESRAQAEDALLEWTTPGLGSNNWVVSGAHTQSGKPLLANDPHLGHGVPSVWYLVHVKAPGFDVIGSSFPGLPGVILGHNESIAWGATNTGPDVQDLYIESFNFRDAKKYLHGKDWVEAEERSETVKVRGARDYTFTVKSTRHGPVISHDGERDLALRWTALEPHALRFPFLKIDQARNWQEFSDALREFSGPMQNFVYADVDGNIGYYAAAWVPMRKQGDGTVPVPGSTDDYDWTGYIPFESLPHAFNPPSGILATANGRIVPDGYPFLITRKWEAPFRTARIDQLLETGARFTVPDMLRVQGDIHALEDERLAKRLAAAGAARPPESEDARYALKILEAWDGEARADSAATLICELTRSALLERVLKPKLREDLSGYTWPMKTIFLENVLDQGWTRWLPSGDADFNATLVRSLEEAVRRIPDVVESRNRSAWRWGDTIPLTFHHPLSVSLPLVGRLLDVGPFPQAGTGTTVKQTTPYIGPSMRMVVDFSDLDQSVQNITLGESGQVFSPYYRDQFDAWYNARSFPMVFSDAAVEKGSAHKLILEPAGQP